MMKFLFLILLLCIFNLNFAESKECQCKTPPNSVEYDKIVCVFSENCIEIFWNKLTMLCYSMLHQRIL